MNQANLDTESCKRRAALDAACARVSLAVRKLATAASLNLGTDCYLHAEIGRALLWDLGFKARRVTGFAAWRIGAGDGDVITHVPPLSGQPSDNERKLHYHTWLEFDGYIVDFTTYTLAHKAQALDAADGGRTTVSWCPPYLVLAANEVHRYRAVAAALDPGVAYYLARPELELTLQPHSLDPEDLQIARYILAHPELQVFGPNHFPSANSQVTNATQRPRGQQ